MSRNHTVGVFGAGALIAPLIASAYESCRWLCESTPPVMIVCVRVRVVVMLVCFTWVLDDRTGSGGRNSDRARCSRHGPMKSRSARPAHPSYERAARLDRLVLGRTAPKNRYVGSVVPQTPPVGPRPSSLFGGGSAELPVHHSPSARTACSATSSPSARTACSSTSPSTAPACRIACGLTRASRTATAHAAMIAAIVA